MCERDRLVRSRDALIQADGDRVNVPDKRAFTGLLAQIDPTHSSITSHSGETLFRQREPGNNRYVRSHADLIASIRNKTPLNETRSVAESTLTAILGREAAYTGQELTWDEAFNADMDVFPKDLTSGKAPAYEIPKPGFTQLVR